MLIEVFKMQFQKSLGLYKLTIATISVFIVGSFTSGETSNDPTDSPFPCLPYPQCKQSMDNLEEQIESFRLVIPEVKAETKTISPEDKTDNDNSTQEDKK